MRGQGRVSHAPLLLWPCEYIDPGAPGVTSVITKVAMFRLKGAVPVRPSDVPLSALIPSLPPPTSNNGVSQSMNMSCLCAPCCVINPPWEPEISPATDLSWLLSFLRSWHSKQNKIYHLVFFLVFSDSVYKSTPFYFYYVVITCLSGPCFKFLLVLTWYSMHFFYLLVGVEHFLAWCCGAAVLFSQCLSGLSGSGFT